MLNARVLLSPKRSTSPSPHRRDAVFVLAALTAFTALADTTGRITGTVTDSHHIAIPAVQITATNKAMGVTTKAKSDKKGAYTFLTLSAGQYDIHAEATGFKPFDRTGLIIHVDSAVKLDIRLEPEE
jgi:hypothetical protein